MLILHDAHLDHNLTLDHLLWLFERFASVDVPFTATVELPARLASLPCDLYGPIMGDEPVDERDVFYAPRGDRPYVSRLVYRPSRDSRLMTVIAGPKGGDACVLYTAFGGMLAPREPMDPDATAYSSLFWQYHALGWNVNTIRV